MAWSDVRTQIQLLADDATFESGGNLYSYLLGWANNVQLEVANEVDIYDHLRTVEGDLTTDNHAWYLPPDYLKTSLRFSNVRVADNNIEIIGFEKLNLLDPDHSDISTNTQPDYVSIEGGVLYVYPKWAGTIVLENYIRKPTDMVADTDLIDLPETGISEDLIVTGVLGRYCFPHLNEREMAKDFYNKKDRSGRFFELLAQYETRLHGQHITWTNRGRFF